MQTIKVQHPGTRMTELTADPEAYFRAVRLKAAKSRQQVARRRFYELLRVSRNKRGED